MRQLIVRAGSACPLLKLVALGLAMAFTFFACSDNAQAELQGEGPSSPSNGAAELCGNVEYDPSIYRCEYGELTGKCNGVDYRPAYQVCNNGRVEDRNPLDPYVPGNGPSSSSLQNQNPGGGSSSSNFSNGGSSSSVSTVIPVAYEFLGSGYNVLTSAYINPSDAIKHRNYPVLNREKMFQDGLLDSTSQPQESFSTVAGNTVRETINKRSLKIGASVEANLPSLPFFSGGISGEYENVTNSRMKESMSFAKLNYYNYKKDVSIKSATKEKLKDYLTDAFKNDLKAKTAAQIIESYGTHIFIQYYRGGSLEANYTYAYNGTADTAAVRKAAGVTFTGIPGVKVSGDISTSTNTSSLANEDNLDFKYQSFGGNTIGVGDLAALKSKFNGWATSITGSNAVICGIADFKSSLIPIWDLASAGGFTTEANALKTEYYNKAGSIKFPLARFYKTDGPKQIKATNNSYPLKCDNCIIDEIEIYALGAGGGGQGGDYITDIVSNTGTGGAGGGGAATYVKLNDLGLKINESVSLDITIGEGGKGGNYYYDTWTEMSGAKGSDGGSTRVVYKSKNITINANGGFGAGGNQSQKVTTKGLGGSASVGNLRKGGSIAAIDTASGKNGTDGHWDNDLDSRGGNAAKIRDFGGGKGAFRGKGGTNLSPAELGGGGRGGYEKNKGTNGENGWVNITFKYFSVEGEAEAKPENYGTACNSYCKWDTGCYEIRTDPDGRYGDANSTCSAAITNCDYYGLGRYSNATCSGTALSSTKPQSCNYYCKWDTGCYELKTDPAGLYGTTLTSCTTAISNCDAYGERFSNGDCL